MKKIGITGGIGSGKSYIAKVFEHLNIPVFYADGEAKKILNQPHVIKQLSQLFQVDLLLPKEKIADRKKIASIVFNDKIKLQQLNSIIHPLTKQEFEDWAMLHQSYPYVIKEAAVMFESGSNQLLQKVICVSAPEKLRIERVIKRSNLTAPQVKEIIRNQINEEERIKLSDYLIINDEQQLLLPQIIKIHLEILKLV